MLQKAKHLVRQQRTRTSSFAATIMKLIVSASLIALLVSLFSLSSAR